jgi:hypothetical protein
MTSEATQNYPTTFVDVPARTQRTTNDVPTYYGPTWDDKFTFGMNNSTPGNTAGINSGGGPLFSDPDFDDGTNGLGSSGNPGSWTLLDQTDPDGEARTPQLGASIGGTGYTSPSSWPGSGGSAANTREIDIVTNNVNGSGFVGFNGDATLPTLAEGWAAGDVGPASLVLP